MQLAFRIESTAHLKGLRMLAAKISHRCLDDGRRQYLDPRAQATASEAEREMGRSMICNTSRGNGLRRISEAVDEDESVTINDLHQ